MKSYATPFAVAGAVLIAALLVATNLITTPGVLWCISPALLLMLWPAGVYLCQKKRYTAFAVIGSVILTMSLSALNWAVSPHVWWFFYAVPLFLCWPAGMLLKGNMLKMVYALLIAAFIAVYCLALNLWLTPRYFWAIHVIFALLWWPLSLYYSGRKAFRSFSVAGSLLIIAYLIACNLLTTPYPWALYACFPVIWWPLAMFSGKKFGRVGFAVLGYLAAIVWYGALNLWLAPGTPWIIFIVFALLWWPVSAIFYGKHRPDLYAVVMSLITIAFFFVINAVYSPNVLWAFYPAFALLWWPVPLLFARKKAWRGFSVVASLMIIGILAAINLLTSTAFLWFIIPSLGILWWPLAMMFKGKHKPFGFAVAGAALLIITLATINVLTSTAFLWFIIPSLGILWWPLALGFRGKHKPFGFAITGAALLIVTLATINVLTSTAFLWFIIPSLGILWWPLAAGFIGKGKPFGFAVAGAALLIGTLLTINLLTSTVFMWSVIPSMGILWWPLAAGFKGKNKPFGLAVAGAALLIGTLAAINLLTAPGFLWFIFPSLGILWWPVGAFFTQRKHPLAFSVAGSLLVIVTVVSINLITSPGFLWCAFPIFGILWWPAGVLFHSAHRRRLAG